MTVRVSMAGYGQVGYCRCCASSLRPEIDERLVRGESVPSIIAWAKEQGFSISKPTVLKHKQHIGHRVVSFVERAAEGFEQSQAVWRAGYQSGYGEGFAAGMKAAA